jgi:F-type H+-transporting ATPase subunit b
LLVHQGHKLICGATYGTHVVGVRCIEVEQMSPLDVLSKLHLDWGYILTQAGSFLILLFLMTKLLFRPIQKLLNERREQVRKAIEDAERQRQEMEKLRSEYEERLAHIEEEARQRLQEAMREAYTARDELLMRAREEAQRILERARQEIQYEREKMLIDLRDFIVEFAAVISEKAVRMTLDREAHRRLIAQIIDKELPRDGSEELARRSN